MNLTQLKIDGRSKLISLLLVMVSLFSVSPQNAWAQDNDNRSLEEQIQTNQHESVKLPQTGFSLNFSEYEVEEGKIVVPLSLEFFRSLQANRDGGKIEYVIKRSQITCFAQNDTQRCIESLPCEVNEEQGVLYCPIVQKDPSSGQEETIIEDNEDDFYVLGVFSYTRAITGEEVRENVDKSPILSISKIKYGSDAVSRL